VIDDHRVPMKSGQVTASELPADWVDSSIADLASHRANAIVGGPFGSDLVSADYVAYGVPVIRGQNMAGRSVGGDFVFVSREKAKALSSNTARPGDILFTQRGTLGQVAIVQNDEFDEYLISQSQMKFSPDLQKCNPGYILHYFRSSFGQRQIFDSAIQTGVPHTNLGILKNYKITLPPKAEQEAIAEALSDADALIESLEQLLTKKRRIKQGTMQGLLTGVLVLRSSNIQNENLDFDDTVFVDIDIPERIMVQPGDILICVRNGSRDLIGKCALIDGRATGMTFGAFMAVFRSPYSSFIYHQVRSEIIKRQIHEHLGATINQITNKSLNSFVVPFPPVAAERQAISELLSDLEAELFQIESKLTKARAIKQGMMQELLTGRIRLV